MDLKSPVQAAGSQERTTWHLPNAGNALQKDPQNDQKTACICKARPRYLSTYMSDGYAAPFQKKETENYLTILKLYEQQEYMYRKSTHSIQGRIVSITQPFLRPIVREYHLNPLQRYMVM